MKRKHLFKEEANQQYLTFANFCIINEQNINVLFMFKLVFVDTNDRFYSNNIVSIQFFNFRIMYRNT